MKEIKIPEETLDAMLAECAKELASMVKSESLNKAEDSTPADQSEGSAGPTAELDKPEEKAPEAAPMAPEMSASSSDSSSSNGSSSDSSSSDSSDSSSSDSSSSDGSSSSSDGSSSSDSSESLSSAHTIEDLQAAYADLDPELLKMHFLAAKAALMACMGADQAEAPMAPPAPAPAPEAPAPAPEAASDMAHEEPTDEMGKKEVSAQEGSGGEMSTDAKGSTGAMAKKGMSPEKVIGMAKSEQDLKIEELEVQLKLQTEAVAKLSEVLQTPIRKSVKSVSDLRFIDKAETTNEKKAPLTKSEVKDKLMGKIREGKLSKSDKELVAKYTCGVVDLSKIEHLLADTAQAGK